MTQKSYSDEAAQMEFSIRGKNSIDLLCPENMELCDLLNVFKERSLSHLVSADEPLHKIIEKYYDYLMPLPPRSPSPSNSDESSPLPVVSKHKPILYPSDHAVEPSFTSAPQKIIKEANLDNIVIEFKPSRITSGQSIKLAPPASPLNQSTVSNEKLVSNKHSIGSTQGTPQDNQDSDLPQSLSMHSSEKKRMKLDRTFAISPQNAYSKS